MTNVTVCIYKKCPVGKVMSPGSYLICETDWTNSNLEDVAGSDKLKQDGTMLISIMRHFSHRVKITMMNLVEVSTFGPSVTIPLVSPSIWWSLHCFLTSFRSSRGDSRPLEIIAEAGNLTLRLQLESIKIGR